MERKTRTGGKEALRKEVSPSAFVVSRNDWIVGKINHIGGLQNGKVHLQWLGYWIGIGHPLAFVEKDGFLFAVVQRLGLVATIPALIFGILRDVIDGACVKGSWYSRSGSVPVISYEDCTGRFHRVQISASLPQPTPE